jgi:AcrR family transcriptional regulator
MIIEGAIKFFAENGFDGSTHQLANYLGVTQPLIYQYFPTKEDLIGAVYENLFQSRWRDEWDGILADRDRPIHDRLVDFYTRYCEVIHSPDWIRVFLYSGLKNMEINLRYAPLIEERAIRRICLEVRAANGLPGVDKVPLTNQEFEAVWTMHGGIFYYGVRRYVYHANVAASTDELIDGAVTVFLEGVLGLTERLGITVK